MMRAEALLVAVVLARVVLELVHPLEVEGDAAFRAVDLEAVVVLAAGGEARALDRAERAVREAHERERGVVDGDPALLLRVLRQRTLLDEGLERAGDLGDLGARDVAAEVERVRQDVAERARARLLLAEAPVERQRRVDAPVLQVRAAVVEDAAELARGHELARQHHRGDAAVVVAQHVRHAGLLHRLPHRLRLAHVVGERLLAQDRLARLRRRDRDLGVAVARRRDVDDVDVGPCDHLAPVGRPLVPAELGRRALDVRRGRGRRSP